MAGAGLTLLVAVSSPVLAIPAQPRPPHIDPALWRHLLDWQLATLETTSFVSEGGTKTTTDRLSGRDTVYDATVWFMKPNRFRLRLDEVPPAGMRPNQYGYQTYICDGKSLFEYDGGARDAAGRRMPTVTEYPLGPDADAQPLLVRVLAGLVDNHPLVQCVNGSLTARRVAERFIVDWLKPDDPHYLILELTPLRPNDQREYERLTLVLIKPKLDPPLDKLAYLPRKAVIVRPWSKGVETWDFPEPKRNANKANGQPVGVADFDAVDPGPGWRTVKPGGPPKP